MMDLARDAQSSGDSGAMRSAAIGPASATRRLARDVVGVTIIKIVVLAVIYVLFFWGASHRLPVDTAAHIADPASLSDTR